MAILGQKASVLANADDQYHRIQEAVFHFSRGNLISAKRLLLRFPYINVSHSSLDLKSFLFLKALWLRFEEEFDHEGNIYLKSFSTRQIDIFNLMATRMPLVSQTAATANTLLTWLVDVHDEVTLLDIGVGTGRQIVSLLEQISILRPIHTKIKIVGVEPSASSLELAQSNILTKAAHLGLNIEFKPVLALAENLTAADWSKHTNGAEALLINEAFALHHIRSSEKKNEVLEHLAGLRPVGFILSEPHSNHTSDDLVLRFNQAWHHYGLVFNVIDQQPLSQLERDAMKIHFFAREIEDVIGMPEDARTERHELADMWLHRLNRAGFSTLDCASSLAGGTTEGIQCSWERDHLSFSYRRQPIVSLMAVTS